MKWKWLLRLKLELSNQKEKNGNKLIPTKNTSIWEKVLSSFNFLLRLLNFCFFLLLFAFDNWPSHYGSSLSLFPLNRKLKFLFKMLFLFHLLFVFLPFSHSLFSEPVFLQFFYQNFSFSLCILQIIKLFLNAQLNVFQKLQSRNMFLIGSCELSFFG